MSTHTTYRRRTLRAALLLFRNTKHHEYGHKMTAADWDLETSKDDARCLMRMILAEQSTPQLPFDGVNA